MNLDYIKEFVALTQYGKFQETADSLYISQSSLSKHILALEKELGNPLILHSGKSGVRLTAFGKSFLPYALQFANLYERLNEELLTPESRHGNRIVIGSLPIVSLYSVFMFLDSYTRDDPNLYMEVINAPQHRLFEMLRDGQCNLIIVQEEPALLQSKEFCSVLYAGDYLAVLLPHDHPLANREFVTAEELKEERFVRLSDDTPANGFPRQKYSVNVSRPSAVIDSVRNHLGISVMPKLPAIHYANDQVTVLDLRPELPVNYYLAYRENTVLPKGVLDLIENTKRNLSG